MHCRRSGLHRRGCGRRKLPREPLFFGVGLSSDDFMSKLRLPLNHRNFWPCLCRRTTPLPPGTSIEVCICVVSAKLALASLSIKLVFTVRVVAEIIRVRMYDHMVTASFSVLHHHWSRLTGAEIAAALCSFIPSLYVAFEAISAFGKASGAEASGAAKFGLREMSSVDAFGL
ncbi:uncharacterized protein DS421_7g208320 [Arachis hypogaea]|nr:uncharacterized protein DS421_7g208320 [Arachis hypogaea]